MARRKSSPLRQLLNPYRILIPVAIGLGWTAYSLITSWQDTDFSGFDFTTSVFFWIGMAVVCMVIRDLAYMFRLRVLTSGELSWRRCFDVVFLWEFASAITPSVVGGTPIAIFLMSKEGYPVGKASTLVLVTALLDEIFFVTVVPFIYLFIGKANLFEADASFPLFQMETAVGAVFWISYSIILCYCIFLSYGLFVNPKGLKTVLMALFRLPVIRRWREAANKVGDEIIAGSLELRQKPFSYYWKSILATYFSWTARYMVINCLILVVAIGYVDHFLIYGRQLVMWLIMMVSPTPGGAGIAEAAFSGFLNEFIPGQYDNFDNVLALLWRVISYYPYLVIGVIILPRWLRRVYLKRKLIKFRTPDPK